MSPSFTGSYIFLKIKDNEPLFYGFLYFFFKLRTMRPSFTGSYIFKKIKDNEPLFYGFLYFLKN